VLDKSEVGKYNETNLLKLSFKMSRGSVRHTGQAKMEEQKMKIKKMRIVALGLILAMTAMSFTSCGGGGNDGGSSEGRTDLNFAVSAEPNSLDPMAIAMMSTFTITYAIYDNLFEKNADGGYDPSICEDYDVSDDGLVYTFKIRDDVKFHDGTQMTAEDVAFSINRTIEKGWAADMVAAIESVEATDDYTVVLTLSRPFGGMIGSLASPYFSIMSKAYLEENGDDIVERKPMGTGAYKFVEWVSGDHITLEANEDYFKGAPSIKTVTFKPITDKNTGLIALQAGEADAFLNVNYSDIPAVEEDDSLAFYSTDLAAVLSLNMNIENEILSDVRVRQAVNYAINRDNIIQGALEGQGTAANSPVPPTCDGYSEDVKGYEYDPDKARELLKEAGYEDGLSFTIKIKEDSKNQKVAQVIQSDLKAVGIDVDIQILEAGAYTTDVYSNGDYEMTISAWCAMFTDAYSLLYSQFHKDCYGGTGNITHVTSDELSSMLDSAAQAGEDEKTAAYTEVAQSIMDNAYVAPLVFEPTTITASADLEGVEADALGIYQVKNFSWK
jgi:peptide/nickel transport system substrate-binding protein